MQHGDDGDTRTDQRLPGEARAIVERYLADADRLLPGRIEGFYVVGSTALGGYRPGRSDIDFLAVVNGDLAPGELRRLRLLHLAGGMRATARALPRGRLLLPGTPNGVFVRAQDLARPLADIVPLASHTGTTFAVGRGFDVNPVGWAVLARHGIAVRGPAPAALGLQLDDGELRAWNRRNLEDYWVPWAERVLARRGAGPAAGWRASWGALGAPRLHCTIATGEVITKEAAGAYALRTFDARWHPLLRAALAYRTSTPAPTASPARAVRAAQEAFARPGSEGARRACEAARFVLEVVGSARAL
jgi:hypothetical protein